MSGVVCTLTLRIGNCCRLTNGPSPRCAAGHVGWFEICSHVIEVLPIASTEPWSYLEPMLPGGIGLTCTRSGLEDEIGPTPSALTVNVSSNDATVVGIFKVMRAPSRVPSA